ncbi:MAG TPA: aldo/keto reductase [Gaiellaceae bacterium]|nr:aldo/keto reductase [Gaiellaceae bacterium]
MERRPLGASGIEVSVVGLGCNNFGNRLGLEATRRVVDAALDLGVNFLDTADIYGDFGGSERLLGEVLEGRRDRVVLATKFGHDMGDGEVARGSRTYLRRAVEASLERLRTDRVDLLYYHRPDGVTPLAETVGAMEELVREGKARALGGSNLDAEQLREVGGRIAALQNHYSLLERSDDAETIPLCRELGVSYVPYFPLASGLLTGKHRRGAIAPGTRLEGREIEEAEFDRVEALERFAQERGHTLLELAFAGLLSQDVIASVISGATKPEQVRANVAAAEWRLSPADFARI